MKHTQFLITQLISQGVRQAHTQAIKRFVHTHRSLFTTICHFHQLVRMTNEVFRVLHVYGVAMGFVGKGFVVALGFVAAMWVVSKESGVATVVVAVELVMVIASRALVELVMMLHGVSL